VDSSDGDVVNGKEHIDPDKPYKYSRLQGHTLLLLLRRFPMNV